MKEISKKITSKRNELGISREKLARESGVTSRTIASIEKGITIPSLRVLLKIFDVLNLRMSIDDNTKEKRFNIDEIKEIINTTLEQNR